jgi:hypothetical protein
MIKGAKNGLSQQIAIRVPHEVLAEAKRRKQETGASVARILLDAIRRDFSRAHAPPNTPDAQRFPSDQHIMTAEERNDELRRQLERLQPK